MNYTDKLARIVLSGNNKRVIFRTIAAFVISLLCLSAIASTSLFNQWVASPLSTHTAKVVNSIIKLFRVDVELFGTILLSNGFGIKIIPACTGIPLAIIFISAMLAFPSRPVQKFSIVTIFLPILYVLNVSRLAILFLIGINKPLWFDFVHLFLGQFIIILLTMALWIFLSDKMIHGRIEQMEP